MTKDKVGRVASLQFLEIAIGFIEDSVLFGMEISVYEVIGATLIVVCSVIIFILKLKKYAD